MILSVFGDESADETRERVFAVSGICGSASEWKIAEQAWLERTGGKVFHAAHCEYENNFELYKDLTQILSTGPIAGIGISLNLIAFHELMPDTLPDAGYYQCFSKVLSATARTASQWNERVAADPHCGEPMVELEFTFDHRIESEGNAGSLYSAFINQPEWRNSPILDTKISFESRKNPRIQMADLVAREAMKDLDREIGPDKFPQRESKRALDAGGFRFLALGRDYCLQLKQMIDEFNPGPDYLAWLHRTKRVQKGRPHDNWSNRFKYFAWLDSRHALRKG